MLRRLAMYYNAPPQTSPAINHKLAAHLDSPWSRVHHPVLGNAGSSGVAPPVPSAYALYTNGQTLHQHMPGMHSHAMAHHHHHHQNSLTHPSYPSPPNGHALQPHGLGQTSPNGSAGQAMTQHWQQQLLKCDMIRTSRSPFHRARQSALAARPTAKNAIAITDPNRVKASEDGGESKEEEAHAENHPSSTVAPIAPAPRPAATYRSESHWNALDMGGILLKNLPRNSALFSFTFLTSLYLNHNQLSAVPAEISSLKQLELLDLSGNGLLSIPPELGMLTNLKELYLFDNHLVTLPHELGTLHQLRTLGIEGNPLDTHMKNMVQNSGTVALITHLRDTCPAPTPPPERMWRLLQSDAERKAQEADPTAETLSVLCYNILCERAATERMYGYTPSWALAWDYRKELILTEIMNYDADILCLQEVDVAQYEDYFLAHLSSSDYEGVYSPKTKAHTMEESQRRVVDGCAIFYKASKYQLVETHVVDFRRVAMQRADFKKTDDMFNRVLQRDDIGVVALLESKETGSRFIISNTHVFWDPNYRDVKLVQTALLMEEVEKFAARFARYPPRLPSVLEDGTQSRPPPHYTDGTKIPTVMCGDFNSGFESGIFEFVVNGSLPPDHEDFMGHKYGNYTSEGLRHRMTMKNAYGSGDELPLTNYTSNFRGSIDHIFYSSNNLAVTSLLGEVDKGYLSKVVGFPNAHFPSDHICILAQFRVKPPKEAPSHPPPTFPNGRS